MFQDFDAIQVGDERSLQKTITADDVRRFVEMTGDDNPLHVDPQYAQTTPFKDVVVHGMLGAAFLSTVIGTQLPGKGALWVSQQMDFLLPVRLGDQLTVTCAVIKKHAGERLLELDTTIVNQHRQKVLTGRGKVKVMQAPGTQAQGTAAEACRVAIVTGGSGGIGSAICERLAKDGYAVVVHYARNADGAQQICDRIKSSGGKAVAVGADLLAEGSAHRLVDAALQNFGGVGLLVNNASARIASIPVQSMQWADIQAHLDVQVKAALTLAQLCAKDMAQRKTGRIVNIGSQATDGVPTSGWLHYTLAKTAQAALTRSLALELGPMGIGVNTVAPGMTDTNLIGDIPEKVQLLTARQTPLRRLATADDIAGAVAYLASDAAQFVTGQTLRVNGGLVM
jgi:3-oxoacyl-[acyl-carrier protein] reductase